MSNEAMAMTTSQEPRMLNRAVDTALNDRGLYKYKHV